MASHYEFSKQQSSWTQFVQTFSRVLWPEVSVCFKQNTVTTVKLWSPLSSADNIVHESSDPLQLHTEQTNQRHHFSNLANSPWAVHTLLGCVYWFIVHSSFNTTHMSKLALKLLELSKSIWNRALDFFIRQPPGGQDGKHNNRSTSNVTHSVF